MAQSPDLPVAPGDGPNPLPRLILASASPRRLDLLAQLGVVPALVLATDIDETPQPREQPAAHALRLAHGKAAAASALHPSALVLAADTVVALGARILPKAEDRATAAACLRQLSGRRHRVVTALVLAEAGGDSRRARSVTSTVAFKRLDAAEIETYLDSGEWQGKAGGYAIQGRAAGFIRFLQGSYSGVVGLPLFETAQLLRAARLLP
ncbi:Maf family protein [Zavarzinia sp. CC-PAN008]|uniref:Maf family protein n=1 Tax=Zavarzinia sp. CC-PAN008 TaxID=3243332 RepID=UPI003F744E7A